MRTPGDPVGRYILQGILGSGGMGDVYEAVDTRLQRNVALKLVKHEGKPAHAQRLLREARAIAAFEHPNAVVIYDVGEVDTEMYIAMELIRGRSLRHFIGDPSISLGRKLRWLVDAARALGAAHRASLVHRDVKPDNIMVRTDGVVKVLDFGIARLERNASQAQSKLVQGDSATVTAEGTLIGTPRYLAPEQLRGDDVDGRTDEFAWAVTAYELITGEAPFSGDTSVALLSKILTSTPKPLSAFVPDAPAALEQALFRAMAKRPEDRFLTIDDAADAFEPFADISTDRTRIPKDIPSSAGQSSPASTAADSASNPCCDPAPTPQAPAELKSVDPDKTNDSRLQKQKSPKRQGLWIAVGTLVLALSAAGLYLAWPAKPAESPATASEKAPPALIVNSLGCEPSTLSGGNPVPELDRAIGFAACSRLALELGVDWNKPSPSHNLSVHTVLSENSAEVTLKIADKTAGAKAPTPLEAIVEAIPKLARQLTAGPLSQEEIARWGAKDADSARRLRKTWLRMILDYEVDDQAAVRELIKAEPNSALSYLMALVTEVGTLENRQAYAARARELLPSLPSAQANYLRHSLEMKGFGDPQNPIPKGVSLLRKAYTEDPQDTQILATMTKDTLGGASPEEGQALHDRLWKLDPAEAVWVMRDACNPGFAPRDLNREAKYMELTRKYIPEALSWDMSVSHYFLTNQIPKAKQAVELGTQLGLTSGVSGSFYFDVGRAWLALATWSPKEAREIANWMMGIPRSMVSNWGANVLAASYFLEGRIMDGFNLTAKQHDVDGNIEFPQKNKANLMMARHLSQRLWLPLPLPSKERLERIQALVKDFNAETREITQLYIELLLLQHDSKHSKQKAEERLKAMEELIAAKPDQTVDQRQRAQLTLLPAIRRLRGNEEAAKLWLSASNAPFAMKRILALEGAMALLGVGKEQEAEAALKLAEDPRMIEAMALSTVIARIKRGALYRAQKRHAEADEIDKQINALWTNADAGIREHFEKLK